VTTTEILERGYRRYDGPRLGVWAAMRSVVRFTVQRCLGIHRPARTKVFPILVIVLAYVPTAVYVGVVVLGNRLQRGGMVPGRAMAQQFVPTYAGLYLSVTLAIVVFAAFVAPEVLCPDRRTGMLGLYLASPLDRWTYLTAKAMAVLMITCAVTVGPGLILLIGYSTQGVGPHGFVDWAATFGRIVGAGLGVAMLDTAVALAISSITSRKAAASATFIALFVGVSGLLGVLVVQGQASNRWGLLNLATLPYEFVFRVFGEPSTITLNAETEVPASLIYAACLAWVGVSLGVVAWRYRRMDVTK